jgi:hypothetical protein
MATRWQLVFILAATFASMGASYRTTNFVVEAPTASIAQQVGQYAEHYRKEKAILWTGQEMPTWPQPCPLRVTVTMNGSGGATSFAFDRGQVLGMHMHIEGSLDRLLASVLPHEVTHTVFANTFRQPVPRWADEGGAVLSEDDIERNRHDQLVRQILNNGRAIPLRTLFSLKEYPRDVMCLYAQGYSVSNYLVSQSSRPAFLQFISQGMREGWDRAAQTHYRFRSVEELEQGWINSLRNPQRPPAQLAQNLRPATPAEPAARQVIVRQTVPPSDPPFAPDKPEAQARGLPPGPLFRGQSPEDNWDSPIRPAPVGRPGPMPQQQFPVQSQPQPGPQQWQPGPQQWQPMGPPPAGPDAVRLGAPEYLPPPPGQPGQPIPGGPSPGGFPR